MQLFGWIWDTVEYENVTLPVNLINKGRQYLNSVINERMTIELSAVDLHHLNCNIEKFKKGDWVRVVSIPHKIDKLFQVTKLSISLDNPKESQLILGQTFETLTQNQLKESKSIHELVVSAKNASVAITQTQSQVNSLREEVSSIDDTVAEISTEYVKTTVFNAYKTEVNQKIASVYTVKGSVASYSILLSLIGCKVGDVYNVLDTGANYVYTNDGWDKLSETVDLSNYYTKNEVDTAFVGMQDFTDLVARVEALESNGNEGGLE